MDTSVSSTAPLVVITDSNLSASHATATTTSTVTIRRPPTGRKYHVWTSLQLVHVVILRQYGGVGISKITQLLNAHFLTNMSLKTVQYRLNLEAGVSTPGEAKQRTDQGKLSTSVLWKKVRDYKNTSFEVKFVLFTHGLLNDSEWTEAMMGPLALLAAPNWTRNKLVGPRGKKLIYLLDSLSHS
ncbi:hypothetical protein MMC27_001249 [Xylographa pallens]|nr:hypothetical protein [Xylographa pallens]